MRQLNVEYCGWGERWPLGRLADDGRTLLFEYAPEALAQGLELSPLHLFSGAQGYRADLMRGGASLLSVVAGVRLEPLRINQAKLMSGARKYALLPVHSPSQKQCPVNSSPGMSFFLPRSFNTRVCHRACK